MSDLFISRERAESNLLDCAAFLAERIKSADGHAEAMAAILPRYLAKGDVDLGAELANAIDDPFTRDRMLILVAEKCAETDDDEYARQLADAVEDHGLRSQALERVALVMAGKGQAEKAAEIAESMEHPDFVYAGIAVNQFGSGNEAAGEKTLGSIDFATARANALEQIAASYIEAGNLEKAAFTLDKAFIAAKEIEHDEERLIALTEIGNLFIHAKRNDKAIEVFDLVMGYADVLTNIHRDQFLVNSALGMLAAGSEKLADRSLDLVTDKTQMATALLGVARNYWKRDMKSDAIDNLDEAYQILKSQRDIETRDSRARNSLMLSVAVQFAAFEKADLAVAIAQENQDPAEQVGALTQIAQLLTLNGNDELARQTMEVIPDDANRLFALVSMSDAKYKLGNTEAATATLDEAAELSETVPQLASRSSVLNEIAERFAVHGEIEKARQATRENLAVIEEIRDESTQATALAGIADVFASAGLEPGEEEKAVMSRLVRKREW